MVRVILNRFHVFIHQDTDRSLSVTVTPCNTRLNWDLKFIPITINQTIICKCVVPWLKLLFNIAKSIFVTSADYTGLFFNTVGNNNFNEYGKLLVEYTGVPTPVTYDHGRAYKGLYVITIQAVDDESNVMFYVSLRRKSQKKQFGFRPNAIKIKEGGQKISLRWNLRCLFQN